MLATPAAHDAVDSTTQGRPLSPPPLKPAQLPRQNSQNTHCARFVMFESLMIYTLVEVNSDSPVRFRSTLLTKQHYLPAQNYDWRENDCSTFSANYKPRNNLALCHRPGAQARIGPNTGSINPTEPDAQMSYPAYNNTYVTNTLHEYLHRDNCFAWSPPNPSNASPESAEGR